MTSDEQAEIAADLARYLAPPAPEPGDLTVAEFVRLSGYSVPQAARKLKDMVEDGIMVELDVLFPGTKRRGHVYRRKAV
jgi:DNA-binding IclR family transcriptional regulator